MWIRMWSLPDCFPFPGDVAVLLFGSRPWGCWVVCLLWESFQFFWNVAAVFVKI